MPNPRLRWSFLAATSVSLGAAALFGNGCSSDKPTPPSALDPSLGWQKVHIQVPTDRYPEFPEGAGLLRRVDPAARRGETDWWVGYFPGFEIDRLRGEGFLVEPLPPGAVEPQATGGASCVQPPLGSIVDQFCSYRLPSVFSTCKRRIQTEMFDVPTDFPPIAGVKYAESFQFGVTKGDVSMMAARVGHISKSGDPVIPQLVLYAGQHAREWIGPEMIMRLFRFFATSWRDNTNGVRALLANVAIVFVPVANPDGYDFTHASPANRLWRTNREPCPNPDAGFGTDPNRNFETTWTQPGNSTSCPNDVFRGGAARSARETDALSNLLAANTGAAVLYRTRFALDMHAYGNFLIFPEGLSPAFKPCTTSSNCTAPDLGAFHDLVGSELSTLMNDEEDQNRNYVVGQTFRDLYAVAGDSVTSSVYGSPSRPGDPKFLSATIEMTDTECGFNAEGIPSWQVGTLFNHLQSLTTTLATKLPSLNDGSFFPAYELPHLHRRQTTGTAGEFPSLRLSARTNVGTVDLGPGGTTHIDDVSDGVAYRMWRWRSDDPYVFPPTFPVCSKGGGCQTVTMGGDKINLCDPNRLSASDGSWSFTGDLAGGPQDECFWSHAGANPAMLTSGKWSISDMAKAHLVYSYRWKQANTKMQVLVSTNGFVNCQLFPGTGCRIVRDYPYGDANYDLRDGSYRTEILDISDFDHSPTIQVRFDVTAAPTKDGMDIYDPVMVGWKQ